VPLLDLANLSDVDEQLFGTWFSHWGAPAMVLDANGNFSAALNDGVYDGGPGAIVAPDLLERGYNPYYGAPGYYADAYGVDRVIPDQYLDNTEPPAIGVNPWDHIFGPIGGDPVHYMQRVQAREEPIQAGEYSLS
jgi:hypothetical protein